MFFIRVIRVIRGHTPLGGDERDRGPYAVFLVPGWLGSRWEELSTNHTDDTNRKSDVFYSCDSCHSWTHSLGSDER